MRQEMTRSTARPRRRPRTEWQTRPLRRQGGPPPGRPARQSRPLAWEATLALLALAIVVAGVATVLFLELWLADRILPGIYAWDVDIGGLSREEAAERLAGSFHYPPDRHLTLRYGDQAWPVDPADLGASLDVKATVDSAMLVGHSGNLSTRLREQLAVLLQSRLVMPVFAFQPGAADMFLSQFGREINRPLRNATLRLGDGLQVEVVPGQSGQEMDVQATSQALQQ
ncbi:MAG: hypothetical protein EHM56_05920, partial [Chloroflexi bacterium]